MAAEKIPELVSATPKQLAYIESMAAHGIGARAGREAGSTKASAGNYHSRMQEKAWVCKAIERRREELNGETGQNPATIRAELWANHQKAIAKGNFSGSNRALELLGKAVGMFGPDKIELTGKDGATLTGAPLSDLELARLASFAIRKAASIPDPVEAADISSPDGRSIISH